MIYSYRYHQPTTLETVPQHYIPTAFCSNILFCLHIQLLLRLYHEDRTTHSAVLVYLLSLQVSSARILTWSILITYLFSRHFARDRRESSIHVLLFSLAIASKTFLTVGWLLYLHPGQHHSVLNLRKNPFPAFQWYHGSSKSPSSYFSS